MTAKKSDAKAPEAAPVLLGSVAVKPLREAVKAACTLIERKASAEILSGLLIVVGPSTLRIVATGYDMQLAQQIDLAEARAAVATAQIVVGGAILGAILAKLPKDGDVRLELDENGRRLRLACRAARFVLPVMDAAEFPAWARIDYKAQFEIGAGEMQALFAAVAFAMSSEEARYYINGIYLHADADADGGRLVAAATDGSQLARCTADLPEGAAGMPGIIVPRKAVSLIDSLLDGSHGPVVDLSVSSRGLLLSVGGLELHCKAIDGTFPDYARVIPTGGENDLWIDPAALAEAVDRVATVAETKTPIVRMALSPDGAGVDISAAAPERGSASETVIADYGGRVMALGFNARFLGGILRHLTAAPALLRMAGPEAPVLLIDSEESRRTYVLMPVRI